MGISLIAPQAFVVLLGILAIAWWGRRVALPTVWFWLLVLLPVLAMTPLPGASIIQQFTIFTSLYMPARCQTCLDGLIAIKDFAKQHHSVHRLKVRQIPKPPGVPSAGTDRDLQESRIESC